MTNALRFTFARRTTGAFCAFVLLAFLARSQTTPAQQPVPKTEAPPAAPQSPSNASDSAEVSSHDTPATFKVRVNLVLVRVVVRDSKGDVVTNLEKQDFQLLDNRKPQVLSTFSVEKPSSHLPKPAVAASAEVTAESAEGAATPGTVAIPQRFVAMVFDDTDLLVEDAVFVRSAATRLFGSLAPSDRVGIYTTSGQLTQEFTDNHALLQQALLGIIPRPVAGAGIRDCPDVEYYEADQIVNFNNEQALAVATTDAIHCAFNGDNSQVRSAQALAQSTAFRVLALGDSQTEFVYRHLEDTMRRLSSKPGQRVMVFVSPGFIVTSQTREHADLIDQANRANIVINTIDARGLYTPDLGDIANPPSGAVQTAGVRSSYRLAGQSAQADILATLADGTGGTFFHNRNDVEVGLRQAVAAPAVSYLIGFSPQNMKIDGRYHTLKVSLKSKQKVTIQARHGYYAPKVIPDPAESAKQEIQEALFSQEEISDLPVDLQTQFFKTDQSDARLAVIAHVDVKGIRFRKEAGRSRDSLTIATVVFDENGKYVTGGEKIIDMRLRDATFERLSRSGVQVKSSFDLKPGTYLVRSVIRDAEGSLMAARNSAVVIPY